MSPSVQEGTSGSWYVLPDVIILENVETSSEAYRLWVTAVDTTGQFSKGYINVKVSDGTTSTKTATTLPTVKLATATDLNTVEVLFSSAIDTKDFSTSGGDFEITEKNNTSETLDISKAVFNSAGTLVTLTTSDQTAGTSYTVIAD